MSFEIDLVNVKVSVNGKEQVIKMERGTSFENKGGIFTAGENNDVLKMTNYQARTFLAMANNNIDDNETINYDEILKNKKNEIDLTGAVLSKKDIQEAQNKYKNGRFVADMSEFLPEGYKIERPKLTSAENMVQAYVTNGKESQSATLKFSIVDTINNLSNKNNEMRSSSGKKNADSDLANQVISYKKGGNTYTITYNKDGKPETFKTTSLQPDEKYIYDKEGRLVEVEYPTRINYSKKYTYHSNGKIAQEILEWNDGEPFTQISTYSPTGQITKKEETRSRDDNEQNGHAIYQYSYDSKGNLKYIITATNMGEAHESISNYEVYSKYTITKTEYKNTKDEWGYYDYTREVLGFSDSADYEKTGLQRSYNNTEWGQVISVDDKDIDVMFTWRPNSTSPAPIYPWGNTLSPEK